MITIGVDIGGTNLRIGCVNKDYTLSNFLQIPQKTILTDDSPMNLAYCIEDYIEKHVMKNDVAGVCVGIPGAVDKNRAVVLSAPNIHGFNGVDIKAILQAHLEVPVLIEKDTNLLLTYDIIKYKIPENDTVIAYYIGTGLGNAIMIDGRILIGHNGAAGELGHTPAWGFEHECSCGNIGCVEPLVAGKYLTALQENCFPETEISRLFEKHGNDSRITEYIKHLSMPIATEINIIDPSTVILGGGVISMAMFPTDELIKAIRFYTRKPLPEANLRFIVSGENRESGVIGAGIHMLRHSLPLPL
ncbi:MAG: allose kinase [Oscillospiraceae bacterium]|jgi:allose kinase|nr:allose kinase [Oscillospiraceae bacterium]